MNEGDTVKVTGYPRLFKWMEEYVGKTGTVSILGHKALCVSFENDDLWIAKSYVEVVESEAA